MADSATSPQGGARAQRDRHRQVARHNSRVAAEPILADLRRTGLSIESIDDLLMPDLEYRSQLPVIVDWIPRCADLAVREVLVRALTTPAARQTEASRVLIQEFASAPNDVYGWAVGLALTGAARAEDAATVVAFFRDKNFGTARQELARVIARLRPPGALEVLVEALDDDDVAGHAVEALGYLGDRRAIPHLDRMKTHPKPWVRKAATTASAKIEKKHFASGESGRRRDGSAGTAEAAVASAATPAAAPRPR